VTLRRRRQAGKPYVGFLFHYYSGPIVNDSSGHVERLIRTASRLTVSRRRPGKGKIHPNSIRLRHTQFSVEKSPTSTPNTSRPRSLGPPFPVTRK
jgi:hypothetical protein